MATKIGPTYRQRPQSLKWQDDAACKKYPNFLDEDDEKKGRPKKEPGSWTNEERLKVCNGEEIEGVWIKPACPVKAECLEYAESLPISDVRHTGLVFGGLTGHKVADRIQKRRKEERERLAREQAEQEQKENEEAA